MTTSPRSGRRTDGSRTPLTNGRSTSRGMEGYAIGKEGGKMTASIGGMLAERD